MKIEREILDEVRKGYRNSEESVFGFHHQFKSITAMSPLQFQKQIRLQESRRLMLGNDLDVSSASSPLVTTTRLISAAIIKNCSVLLLSATSAGCATILKLKKA